MTDAQSTDSMRILVLLILCLAILGAVIALAVYLTIEILARQAAALTLPSNARIPLPIFGYPTSPGR